MLLTGTFVTEVRKPERFGKRLIGKNELSGCLKRLKQQKNNGNLFFDLVYWAMRKKLLEILNDIERIK